MKLDRSSMEGAAASRPVRLEAGAASIMSQGGFEMVTRGSRRCAKGKGAKPQRMLGSRFPRVCPWEHSPLDEGLNVCVGGRSRSTVRTVCIG